MTPTFIITVFGVPAPQGSKRHVGNGRMIESSKKVGPWRDSVAWAAVEAWQGKLPIAGPVSIVIWFAVHKAKKPPKASRLYPVTRSSGDLDKLLRSTFDALVTAGVIGDDSQIVAVTATKAYGVGGMPIGATGARIELTELP